MDEGAEATLMAPGGGEGGPRTLDPRVRIAWWIAGTVRAALATAAAVAADVILPRHLDAWPTGWFPVTVGLLSFGLALVLPPVRFRRWRYHLRPHDVWIRRGILWVAVSVIPYARLQFVDTEQGPLERALGLASLVVYTAAPGTSGRIPGLDAEEAEELRERVAHLDETPGTELPRHGEAGGR